MNSEKDLGGKVATQHHLIDSLLAGLRRALENADAARAKGRLASLHRAVEAHFKLEENHYFPARRASRPELEADLERLVAEHARFRSQLTRIGAEIESADCEAASRSLGSFDTALHEHEEFEHEVLAD